MAWPQSCRGGVLLYRVQEVQVAQRYAASLTVRPELILTKLQVTSNGGLVLSAN